MDGHEPMTMTPFQRPARLHEICVRLRPVLKRKRNSAQCAIAATTMTCTNRPTDGKEWLHGCAFVRQKVLRKLHGAEVLLGPSRRAQLARHHLMLKAAFHTRSTGRECHPCATVKHFLDGKNGELPFHEKLAMNFPYSVAR